MRFENLRAECEGQASGAGGGGHIAPRGGSNVRSERTYCGFIRMCGVRRVRYVPPMAADANTGIGPVRRGRNGGTVNTDPNTNTNDRADRRAGIVARGRGNHRAVRVDRVNPDAAGMVAPTTVATTPNGRADVPVSASGARCVDAAIAAVPASDRPVVRAAIHVAAVAFRDAHAAAFAVTRPRATRVCDADVAAACGFGADPAGDGAAAFRAAFGIPAPSAPTGTSAPADAVFVRADGRTTADPDDARATWVAVA